VQRGRKLSREERNRLYQHPKFGRGFDMTTIQIQKSKNNPDGTDTYWIIRHTGEVEEVTMTR